MLRVKSAFQNYPPCCGGPLGLLPAAGQPEGARFNLKRSNLGLGILGGHLVRLSFQDEGPQADRRSGSISHRANGQRRRTEPPNSYSTCTLLPLDQLDRFAARTLDQHRTHLADPVGLREQPDAFGAQFGDPGIEIRHAQRDVID